MPSLVPSAICASASDRASEIFRSAERSRPDATDSSIDLAMSTVQVTIEAKASPIITAFTMTSADMNITQGDNSFMAGAAADAVSGFADAGAMAAGDAVGAAGAVAVEAAGAGAAGAVVDDAAGAGLAGAGRAMDGAGAAGGVCVWAETGDASQAAASIKAAARLAWKDMIFILRPSSE